MRGAHRPRHRGGALILLLVLLAAAFLQGAPDAGATIYPQRSIAGAKIGMTAKQVVRNLGRPFFVTRSSPFWTYYYLRVRVRGRRGSGVIELRALSNRERTLTGVGLGSTEQQLVRGVAGISCVSDSSVARRCRVGTGQVGTRTTDFLLFSDRVVSLTIQRVPDTEPPSSPTGLVVTGTTQTSISLAWNAAGDNSGTVAYGLYRDGLRVATTVATAGTIGDLGCGKTYALSVDATDPAGNRSTQTTVRATTSSCPPAEGPPDAADLYMSPSGSDANPCTQAAPCLTFARAYRVARLGDVVEVAGGSYPGETLTGDLAKARDEPLADPVVFRPATGASVEITGTLEIRVPHIELRDMTIFRYKARRKTFDPSYASAGDLTFRNIRAKTAALSVARNVWIIGGELGPNANPGGIWPDDGLFTGGTSNVVVDGLYVHDITKPDEKAHSDCIQMAGGTRWVIRNSRFQNCFNAPLMIKADLGPINNILIENNFVGATNGYFGINLNGNGGECVNIDIRYNSFADKGIRDDCRGLVISSNIEPAMPSSWFCRGALEAGVIREYNVYGSGIPCGPNDVVAPMGYVDPSSLNLHLVAGAAAVGRGNPTSFPKTDIDGRSRPSGAGTPDAGASESP